MSNNPSFDVIVIGGGHAGAEAALASARVGAKTLLLTINLDHIGQMSCNPAIGGIAKGQVAREVDALGGAMGSVADANTIQFRMLNRGKGPAVWSPRAQCDKAAYQRAVKRRLERAENLSTHQALAESFIIDGKGALQGVVTHFGDVFMCRAVVIATGTFLSGKLHYGLKNFPGGRAGDQPSERLPIAMREQLGLELGRLKTGTPPRVLGRSLDFSAMEEQKAENPDEAFSHFPEPNEPEVTRHDMSCFMTRTTKATAEIIRQNIDKSPLYQGVIQGIGTRYCPSFEDKVVRFPQHETHIIFLEPEGENTDEYYLNGISTSLPPEVQRMMLQSVPGLERASIMRYAYAIEYDFAFPYQIERSLRVKKHPNLFLAGQLNGTSGYEEAAGQGLLAGLNAARAAAGQDPVEFGRETSYIGVMADDLANKDIIEPYRLFTSRAEYRLHLRQDNADLRLCPLASRLGLLPEWKQKLFNAYSEKLEASIALARSTRHEGKLLWEILRDMEGLDEGATLPFPAGLLGLNQEAKEDRRVMRQMAVQAHYAGYLEREEREIEALRDLEKVRIPPGIDYSTIPGMRTEARSKLAKFAPSTLAQAGRIDGVTPSELSILRIHLKRRLSETE